MKIRLDNAMVNCGIVASRSQAESYIKLGKVAVDGKIITKSGYFVNENAEIKLEQNKQYVSRAGLKLASVARELGVDFKDKVVLDVGSSTGGFTDYALQHGAKKVIAVDVGTNQLNPKLRGDKRIELHEKTDIRNVYHGKITDSAVKSDPTESLANFDSADTAQPRTSRTGVYLEDTPDLVLVDVSFISLRDILPYLIKNIYPISHFPVFSPQIITMLKPQFEAGKDQTNKGIIKNDSMRRQILRDFEEWSKKYFVIVDKRDSDVSGAKGNQERFYLLQPLQSFRVEP